MNNKTTQQSPPDQSFFDGRPSATPAGRWSSSLPRKTLIGFMVALITVVAMSVISYHALQVRSTSVHELLQSFERTRAVGELLSTLTEAETGQRGFLLTGSESFLEPYTAALVALPRQSAELRRLIENNPVELKQLDAIESRVADRLAWLQENIKLERAGQAEAAREMVRTGTGKEKMDRVRAAIEELLVTERALEVARTQEWEQAAAFSMFANWTGISILFFLIVAAAVVSSQDFREMQTQAWLRAGQNELSVRLQGEQDIDQLGEKIVSFVARYLNAQVGAMYFAGEEGRLRLVGAYAIPARTSDGSDMDRPVGGITRQAMQEKSVLRVNDVPQDYFPVSSGLGGSRPRHLVIAPTSADGVANAVLELGFFREVSPLAEPGVPLPVVATLRTGVQALCGTAQFSGQRRWAPR